MSCERSPKTKHANTYSHDSTQPENAGSGKADKATTTALSNTPPFTHTQSEHTERHTHYSSGQSHKANTSTTPATKSSAATQTT
jgi:hypothetical protein